MTVAASVPEARADSFLALSGIGKRFGGTVALDAIDWSVEPGEVHCLVGENGSGKSTLIKILAGVHAPEPGGTITIDGVAHRALTPHQAKALGIQVIFQDLSLFPNLTVLENIAIDHELGSALGAAPRAPCARPRWPRLHGSMRTCRSMRRSATCRSRSARSLRSAAGLAANARLLFMDEPTASLTRHEVDLLLADRAPPEGAGRRDRVRQSSPGGGGRDRRARDRAARRPQGRDLSRIRGRRPSPGRADDRDAASSTRCGRGASKQASLCWSCAMPVAPASSTMSASRFMPARSSASRDCSAPGAPSWRSLCSA